MGKWGHPGPRSVRNLVIFRHIQNCRAQALCQGLLLVELYGQLGGKGQGRLNGQGRGKGAERFTGRWMGKFTGKCIGRRMDGC